MLVLRRKVGEAIIIGEGIEVVVLDIEGDRVKLGINAPKHIDVVRKELLDEVTEENKRALNHNPEIDVINLLKHISTDNR